LILLIGEVLEVEELFLFVHFEFLEVLEDFIESNVSDTEGGEDVAGCICTCLFNVIVLVVDKLLIFDSSLGGLAMEEGSEGSGLIELLAVLAIDEFLPRSTSPRF
jgi:hypothetical protein